MKVCRPDFYKEFQCIGSKCKDTCCALWEIEVDEYSAERYAQHEGPLKEDFRKYLVRKEDENYFRLTADKRCPFLNEQNLCRMILTIGEDYICDICREHPRFYHWFGDYTEVGLGLCCEEAGRLLFERTEPLKFEVLVDDDADDTIEGADESDTDDTAEGASEGIVDFVDDDENDFAWEEDGEEDIWVELLVKARETLIEMLQNRELSLGDRMQQLLAFAENVQPFLDEEDLEGMEAFLEDWKGSGNLHWEYVFTAEDTGRLLNMLKYFEGLESLDQAWPEQMRKMQENLPELLEKVPAFAEAVKEAGRETDYEHLLVYFVFRYFMEAVFDSNILSPLRFAAVSVQMLLLLDLENWNRLGTCSLEDRIRIAKWYSKEIEYCPDNMEALTCLLEEDRAWL